VQLRESSVACPYSRLSLGMSAFHPDRQRVSARARASPSWIDGRRRSTHGALCEN
jgi:hypothetical protein